MSQLAKAQAVVLPTREEMLRRDSSVNDFWAKNRELFVDAWKEWDELNQKNLSLPSSKLLDSQLRDAVDQAWSNPVKEGYVKELLKEVSPGVYEFQFFDPEKIFEFRDYLEWVSLAKIPLRPPYGIALNRNGAMLDRRSEGYLAAPSFQNFYEMLMNKYMRPIARLVFPEIFGFDSQTFGFSIQYKPGTDTSLRMHTDASAVTLNINLNKPSELFEGSEVDFHNSQAGKIKRVKFQPGVAIIHRGKVAHQARPIISGKRTNFVLWLYGDKMQIPRFNLSQKELPSAKKRWSVPTNRPDNYAPF